MVGFYPDDIRPASVDCCLSRKHHPKRIGPPRDRKLFLPVNGLRMPRADNPVTDSYGSFAVFQRVLRWS